MLDGRKRESAFVEMKLELASSMRLCKSTVPVSYNFINLSLIFHWISDAKTDNTERLSFFRRLFRAGIGEQSRDSI